MMPNETRMELPSDTEILITRRFNGPARIVFSAYTRADLVAKWWAPRALGVTMVSAQSDVRPGGLYRYVLNSPRTGDAAFSGAYSEVTPSTRLAYTQVYEPMKHVGEAHVVIDFEESDGGTHVTFRETYPNKFVRDAVIESGMEAGMRNIMDQLEELVATLLSETSHP